MNDLKGVEYIRTSRGISYKERERQREVNRRCANYRRIPLVDSYTDAGVDGSTSLVHREGAAALVRDAWDGQFNVIFVASVDRIARERAEVVKFMLVMTQLGVKIILADLDQELTLYWMETEAWQRK